ncbi:hypothetical protein LNTAR_09916 [Lentisphaera araneosa HTCC2155]|uniref:Cytochrome c domain-containing protein n=2 Tax=Lentisphaera TaxID=256846 RepID=A6DU74_9BACT|nr:hypothetical protein LNTAR_09916 [Lentisphaera araneosa HTCC2155]
MNTASSQGTNKHKRISSQKALKSGPGVHETALNKSALQPFLEKHCISCHGEKKQKGSTRFDHLDYVVSDSFEAFDYQDILDVLNTGDMPPEEEPQPEKEELEVVIKELTEGLFTAGKNLTSRGGKVTMRRLTRREYAATIRDIFGLEPEAKQIPVDEGVQNFDTVGVRQDFNSKHIDHYYDLAREVLKTSFKLAGKKEAFAVVENQPEERTNGHVQKFLDLHAHKPKGSGKVYRLSRDREAYVSLPKYKTGVYLAQPIRHLSYGFKIDPRAKYKISVKSGVYGQVAAFRRYVRLQEGRSENLLGVIRVNGTEDQPTESTIEITPKTLRDRIGGYVAEDRSGAWLSHYLSFIERYEGVDAKKEGLIWIDSFKCEGPYYPAERSFFDQLLCPEEPTPEKPSSMVWNDENVNELLEKFTYEAFRHKEPSEDFLLGLNEFHKNQRALGLSFEEALIDTLAVVLSSPSFLFLNEDNQKEISNKDKAIRMSYFLTSSPPDKQLYSKFHQGSVSELAQRAEVDRLLAKTDYRDFSEGFASQWADFTRFDNITVNSKKYPTFNMGLRYSMKQEVINYFQEMLRRNSPIATLIKSDFITINAQLATLYGIPNMTSNEFISVPLPKNSPRGGFLSQGVFLLSGSNGERSSPTIRGMMLLNRFMNKEVPPPPPNVPELGAESDEVLTTRKLVELHQSQVQCASCHRDMDNMGLAIENFDVIGRWRETERVSRDEIPIKVAGSFADGKTFESYSEFTKHLVGYEEKLARNMIESLLVYSLGRDIEFTDMSHIDEIISKTKEQNFRIKDMIYAVIESPLFIKN